MADGASHRLHDTWRGQTRLSQALTPGSRLMAICRCGRETVVDPKVWVGQGLARQAMASLETRLRCVCGARQARLEVHDLADAPHLARGGIFVFR